MEYECGPLLLYSQDKIRMMDFLSDVFEFDVDSVSDSVHRGPLFIKLCALVNPNESATNNAVVFSFKVKSEQQLREIMSKYNFFLYRKANNYNVQEKIQLEQSENKTTLTISDIDHRLWRFEYETRTEI
jgi:hypothetical protein